MSCHRFDLGNYTGIICFNNMYKYKGKIFEFHDFFGYTELTKDLNPRKRNSKDFYLIAEEFDILKNKEDYRI
jgi:hypothetical protein